MIDQPLANNIPEGEGFMFPENSYVGTCQCGQSYVAPKGVVHCHKCLYEKIKLLEKERDNLKRPIELGDRVVFSKQALQAHNLQQTRKGFWLGFEDARCHPDEMNILKQWEGTKVFSEAIKDGE